MAEILPFTASDLPLLEAIRPPDWPDILTPFTNYLAHPESYLPLKLVTDGELIGTGCLILHRDTAWLGHIIVSPKHRGQGHGQRMTEHLLAISRDLGTDTTYLLATELGAPVYSKAGFQDDGAYEFYQLPKTIPPNPESAVLIPIQPSHWAAILELDRITTGEHRMVLLSKHLPQGYACLESGELTGYYLPTWGDGLIVAKTEDAGLAMLLRRLESKEITCLPVENVHAASVLARLEARPFRTIKKMRFGPERDWKPQFIYNRIGGNLG